MNYRMEFIKSIQLSRSQMFNFKLKYFRLKRVSSCCLKEKDQIVHLLIGTEGGNVYQLDTKTFELTDHIIYQDRVVQK